MVTEEGIVWWAAAEGAQRMIEGVRVSENPDAGLATRWRWGGVPLILGFLSDCTL